MIKQELILTNRGLQDLNPLLIGMEECVPNHHFGPATRNYTLLHLVVSGKGFFRVGGKTYPVKSGEIFRILPGEVTYYQADAEEPWCYRWLGFDGALSKDFASLPPVFPVSSIGARCFRFEDVEGASPEFRIASRLFRLYAELFERRESKAESYVQRVLDYVEVSYMYPGLRVEEIANQLHLDRHYLSRLFRNRTGQTLQDYIISVRMEEALRCLSQGLTVVDTAERCGYSDPFLFSKMFKRRYGLSPTHWKSAHRAV